MKIIQVLCSFALLLCAPIRAQVTQQFTGTIDSVGYSGGPGFFSTPVGTQVSGSFTVTTGNLGTPITLSLGTEVVNEWNQSVAGNITPGNSDSVTASSSYGTFIATDLQSVVLGQTHRADLEYGNGQIASGASGGLAIVCPTSHNLPIDVSAFPLTLPPGCTAEIDLNENGNQYFITIDLMNLGQAAPVAQMIDPVTSGFLLPYSQAVIVNTYAPAIASGGSIIKGAAADGVAEILIRIPASKIGQGFGLTLLNEKGVADTVLADGGFVPLGAGTTGVASALSISAIDTGTAGPMAFAVYVPPLDFARNSGDYNLASRVLQIQISATGLTNSTTQMLLVRPPVFLVHGLWANPSSWNDFRAVIDNTALNAGPYGGVGYADYSQLAYGLTNASPSPAPSVSFIRMNSLGLSTTSPIVEAELRTLIKDYRTTFQVASIQADVIGHSMGGDVVKAVGLLSDFLSPDTYRQGAVHKLITVGTPHLGSPLATDLLNGTSDCSALVLGAFGMPSFEFVQFGSNPPVPGAVFDLEGNGDGSGISSSFLKNTHSSVMPFPMAYISAISGTPNWAGLSAGAGQFVHSLCTLAGQDTIANALTPQGWSTLFPSDQSDSVVPLKSQQNGDTSSSGSTTSGNIIHSPGIEGLSFVGPSEVDPASGIGSAAVMLLNTSTTSAAFHQKGQPQ